MSRSHAKGPSSSRRPQLQAKDREAKLIEKLRVDAIETGFVTEADRPVIVRSLSTMLENCVICVPVSLDRAGSSGLTDLPGKASTAHLIVPTSTVQMEYVYRLKAESVLNQVKETVAYCASLCPSVEFTAEDATRSEPDFLSAIVDAAIASGAGTITLCDTAGEKTPDEIRLHRRDAPKNAALKDVSLSFT